MSNRSRARFRPTAAEEMADDEKTAADVAEQEQRAAVVDDMLGAFDKGDTRGGFSKWAGMILRDRDKALADPAKPVTAEQTWATRRKPYVSSGPLREPTPFEAAILYALGNRTTVIDGVRGPIPAPVNTVSGGMYGGTVEPERVAKRRRRNKAARAARGGKRRRVYGRVYQSRFGYGVTVPGITPDTIVDAEVIDDDELVDA